MILIENDNLISSSPLRATFMKTRVNQNITINQDLFFQFKKELTMNEEDKSVVKFCIPIRKKYRSTLPQRLRPAVSVQTAPPSSPGGQASVQFKIQSQSQSQSQLQQGIPNKSVSMPPEYSGKAVFSYSKVSQSQSPSRSQKSYARRNDFFWRSN